MQSQHRYSEVNTLLARAEQEMETKWIPPCTAISTPCAPGGD
jgi:ATP/maltotriose-dependent transcriptional regulator MalT